MASKPQSFENILTDHIRPYRNISSIADEHIQAILAAHEAEVETRVKAELISLLNDDAITTDKYAVIGRLEELEAESRSKE